MLIYMRTFFLRIFFIGIIAFVPLFASAAPHTKTTVEVTPPSHLDTVTTPDTYVSFFQSLFSRFLSFVPLFASASTAPTVTAVTPAPAPLWWTITVTGTDFTASGNTVRFGTPTRLFTIASNVASTDGSSLQFQLSPVQNCAVANASCVLVVTNANGASAQFPITVGATPPPRLDTVTPSSGPFGTSVTVTGEFGRGGNIYFNVGGASVMATPIAANTYSLVIPLPTQFPVCWPSERCDIGVQRGTTAGNNLPFMVDQSLPPAPTITDLQLVANSEDRPNGKIVIRGTGFTPTENRIFISRTLRGTELNNDIGHMASYENGTMLRVPFFPSLTDCVLGETCEIGVVNANGTAKRVIQLPESLAAPGPLPRITTFSKNASVGGQITITGNGFTATGNEVYMWNSAALPRRGVALAAYDLASADGATLTFTVPATLQSCDHGSRSCAMYDTIASTQPDDFADFSIRVINANGASQFGAGYIRVANTPPSTITEVSPTSGPDGTVITLRGTNFKASGNDIYFGGTRYTSNVVSADRTTITFTLRVPINNSNVPCPVNQACPIYVYNAYGNSNTVIFTVTPKPPRVPTITSVTPTEMVFGQPVTISGKDFGYTNIVRLNGHQVAIGYTSSSTELTLTIPVDPNETRYMVYCWPGQSCDLEIESANIRTNKFPVTRTLLPEPAPRITEVRPMSVVPGTPVRVVGSGFTPTGNRVQIGNMGSGELASSDGQTLLYQLPPTATCPISQQCSVGVINANGYTAISGFSFTSSTAQRPTITRLAPDSGPVGTVVSIEGSGFTLTNNTIYYGISNGTSLVQPSANEEGTLITFTIPEIRGCSVGMQCALDVRNANGGSTRKLFRLTTTPSPEPVPPPTEQAPTTPPSQPAEQTPPPSSPPAAEVPPSQESQEQPSSEQSPSSLPPTTLPDFTLSGATLTPTSLLWTLENLGVEVSRKKTMSIEHAWLKENGRILKKSTIIVKTALPYVFTTNGTPQTSAQRQIATFVKKAPKGAVTLQITVDSNKQFKESNETNNIIKVP